MKRAWRWNGWGRPDIEQKASDALTHRLRERLPLPEAHGGGSPASPYSLGLSEKCAQLGEKKVVAPWLKDLSCSWSTEDVHRLHFGHGQSFPDWLRLNSPLPLRGVDAVVWPEDEKDIQRLCALALTQDWDLLPHGGGTSVVGHFEDSGRNRPRVVLSLAKMNRLLDLDRNSLLARFQCGVLGPELELQLQPFGLMLGHTPQSFVHSSLGGWIVTRSSGQQSRAFGRMDQNFKGGTLVQADQQVCVRPVPASGAGPDWRQLISGSEGRLGVLSDAWIQVRPIPEREMVLAFFLPDWFHGLEAVRRLAQSQLALSMVRLSNPTETQNFWAMSEHQEPIVWLRRYLKGRGRDPRKVCLALVGLSGDAGSVRSSLSSVKRHLRAFGALSLGRLLEGQWQKKRFLTPYFRNTLWQMGYGVDTMETAVPWSRVAAMAEAIEQSIRRAFPAGVEVFCHLSHVYPTGSTIYTTVVFPLIANSAQQWRQWQCMKQSVNQTIIEGGGTISHQHGVGRDHRQAYGAESGPLPLEWLKQMHRASAGAACLNPGILWEEA
jgi:alkyldihydroxyacetonephosphate synthase